MAFVIRFAPQGLNAAKYNEAIRRLEEAGAGMPEGRLYLVCFGDKENLRVSEIWDSVENFEKFGPTLMPILHEVGIDPGEPEIVEVYDIIKG
ncbi:MAG: hypothetical protein KIT57_14395 [Blastocatellales bacterium]|nr:hypothetical protein [Blastocatellales bacterium]